MADQDAAKSQKRLMQFRIPLVADPKAAILMQPTKRAFHDPTKDAQTTAMFRIPLCQDRFDAALAQGVPVRFRIVGAISLHAFRALPWSSWFARHGRNPIDQRNKLSYVVAIRGGNLSRQRDAMGVRDHMVLRAFFSAIRGIGTGVRPPKTARTEAESTTARDQSILSAACKCVNKSRCSLAQTPAFCHFRKRRQQLMPQPHPNSWGKYSQGIPVMSTNKTPVNASRLPMGLRPGNRKRRRLGLGKIGSMIVHNASSRIGLAMIVPPCTAMTLIDLSRVN